MDFTGDKAKHSPGPTTQSTISLRSLTHSLTVLLTHHVAQALLNQFNLPRCRWQITDEIIANYIHSFIVDGNGRGKNATVASGVKVASL